MDEYISWETGEIKDKFGNTRFFIEFGANENCVIVRNIDGNIVDFRVSSNSIELDTRREKTLEEIYKDWKYYEQI